MPQINTDHTAPNTVISSSIPSGRPSVIQLSIKDKSALYAAYIPQFTDGGVFVPTSRPFQLGDSVYVLLGLPDEPEKIPLAGKVAWITPNGAPGGRTQGVGLKFPSNEKSQQLKIKIETILGTALASERPTQTI